MNNKEKLINSLKEEFMQLDIPDNSNIIKARYLEQQKSKTQKSKTTIFKPRLSFLLTFLLLLITSFALLIPSSDEIPSYTHPFKTNEELMAFEIVTVGYLIDNLNSTSQLSSSSNHNLLLLNNSNPLDEYIDEIHYYLGIVDQVIPNEDKHFEILNSKSDLSDYQYKTTIITKDLANEEITYTLHYNEEIINKKTNKAGKIITLKSDILGILIIDNNTYQLTGSKETDKDEVEISLKAKIDNHNWIKIEQETESDESNFEYIICTNGIKSSLDVDIEFEKNKTEAKIKLKDNQKKQMFKFEIDHQSNPKEIIVNYSDDYISFKLIAIATVDKNNEVIYEYRTSDAKLKFYKRSNHRKGKTKN